MASVCERRPISSSRMRLFAGATGFERLQGSLPSSGTVDFYNTVRRFAGEGIISIETTISSSRLHGILGPVRSLVCHPPQCPFLFQPNHETWRCRWGQSICHAEGIIPARPSHSNCSANTINQKLNSLSQQRDANIFQLPYDTMWLINSLKLVCSLSGWDPLERKSVCILYFAIAETLWSDAPWCVRGHYADQLPRKNNITQTIRT